MNLKGILLCLIALSISIDAGKKKLLKKLSKELGYNLEKAIKQIIQEAESISLKVEDSELEIKNIEDKVATNTRNIAINAADIATYHPVSKLMITTGTPSSIATRKTEIVDVANGFSCSDLARFPVEITVAVGANLGGIPVVCGGWGSSIEYSAKCFRLTNSVWENFASMKEKRGYAAGVMHNDKLHVFGGYSGSTVTFGLQTSETINVDGKVSYGPHLPTGVWRHAMIKINDTVSLLSGGETTVEYFSAQTWYYNHDTEAFTSGPDLLKGRWDHGSAINVDKVTKAKIAVITGGYNNGILDSTEMLINGKWQTGPPLPKAIRGISMLYMNGLTYAIGGSSMNGYESSIYQLSCYFGLCSWTTLIQQVKVGRRDSVAIVVQDYYCT